MMHRSTPRHGRALRGLVPAARLIMVAGCAWLAMASPATAQPVPAPPTYAGDLWSRPRLSGDWFGTRDELAKKGITFDLDLLLSPQGIVTGGRETGAEFWGNVDYTLGVDTQKLGLWPGGFLNVFAISGFGTDVLDASGAIVPVNTAAILPEPGRQTTALMNLSFMQFLSPKFGLVAGKLYTLDVADPNDLAHDFHTTFMNAGLNFNMVLATLPFSAYGGGIIVLPWDGATFGVTVLDPSGTPTNNDISEAFSDGLLLNGQGRVAVKPFGLLGHQTVGFTWSNKEQLALDQDPANLARMLLFSQFPRLGNPGPLLERILRRFFPQLLVPVQPANTVSSTWTVYYNFDQFLWSPKGDPTRGIGPFFRFGVSDGEANPVKYAYNVGVGAKGIIPGRPHDSFGIGWARTQFSDSFVPFLRQRLGLGLDKEDAVEMYYNAQLTPWLSATADLQIVEPALKKTLDSNNQLQDNTTALILGLRLYARF